MADPAPTDPIMQPATPSPGPSNATPFPDEADLAGDISDIQSEFEPRIEKQEQLSETREAEAVRQEELVAAEAEKQAGEMSTEDLEMQHWVDHTPTRQAVAATTMHAAPLLAILTALGGKVTRLNGMQMLSATTGMMKGLNSANEKLYNDSMEQWKAGYQKMRDHQRRIADAHALMLQAYQGRADAYQKAADAARRMTGDLLSAQQRQVDQRINLFKAQSANVERLARVNLGYDQLHEKTRHDIAQEAWWQQKLSSAGNLPSDIKMQLQLEHNRWGNAKAQKDQNLRRRGEVNSSLTMPEDQRKAALDRIDLEDEALTMEMDRAQSNADAILAAWEQGNRSGVPKGPPQPLRPGTTTPPPAGEAAPPGTQNPNEPPGGAATPDMPFHPPPNRPGRPPLTAADTRAAGTIDRSGAPPAILEALRRVPPGSVVHGSDKSAWIMGEDGQAQRLQ